jgi:D-amino-acid dehydrogenase
MSEAAPDALILGAGAVGLSCALHLLESGRSVRILERGRVGAATSHGNCGTITPSHAPPLASPATLLKGLKWMLQPDAPLYIKPRMDPGLVSWLLHFAGRCNERDRRASAAAKGALLALSRQLLQELVKRHGLDCEFQTRGLRYVYRDPAAMEHDCAELEQLSELGIESSLLSSSQLERVEPALKPGLAGAIHFPGDAHLRPDRYTAELARVVRSLGGVIEEGNEANGLLLARGEVAGAQSAFGPRPAANVVVCLGPWSAPWLKPYRLKLPIQPGKGYSITWSRPALAPTVPLVLREQSVCVTAWDSGFRLGSTMEFSGYDGSLNRVRLEALERAAAQYLHHPSGPERREEWFGWRPMTYDDLPIIGPAPGLDGLWLATGHGMMGMGMSTATGRLLAELIGNTEPCINPTAYRADRFA